MLVLSRKKDERIMIGENVELTVIEIRGDRVKLGFTGPQEVPIHREEVFRRIETCDEAHGEIGPGSCHCENVG